MTYDEWEEKEWHPGLLIYDRESFRMGWSYGVMATQKEQGWLERRLKAWINLLWPHAEPSLRDVEMGAEIERYLKTGEMEPPPARSRLRGSEAGMSIPKYPFVCQCGHESKWGTSDLLLRGASIRCPHCAVRVEVTFRHAKGGPWNLVEVQPSR